MRLSGWTATCPACGSVAVRPAGFAGSDARDLQCARCRHVAPRAAFIARPDPDRSDRPVIAGWVQPVRPLD